MAGQVERRRAERRSGQDRRASERTDALPQRAQLRRQADLLACLSSPSEEEQGLGKAFSCLDASAIHFERPGGLLSA
jgi:hypothetical protein